MMKPLIFVTLVAGGMATAVSAADLTEYGVPHPKPSLLSRLDVGILVGGVIGTFGGPSDSGGEFPGDGEDALDGGSAGVVIGFEGFGDQVLSFGTELALRQRSLDGYDTCPNSAYECGFSLGNSATLSAKVTMTSHVGLTLFATAGVVVSEGRAKVREIATGSVASQSKTMAGLELSLGAGFPVSDHLFVRGALVGQSFADQNFSSTPAAVSLDIRTQSFEAGLIYQF